MIKKVAIYVVFVVLAVYIPGLLSIGAQTSSHLLAFIASLLVLASSRFLRSNVYFDRKILFVLPFLLYYLASAFAFERLITALLPSFAMSFFVFADSRRTKYLILPGILISFLFSFFLSPKASYNSHFKLLPEHNISSFQFVNSEDSSDLITLSGCSIIETWGKGCGQCFKAMQDLEVLFESLENEYEFSHEYIYIGSLTQSEIALFRSKNYLLNHSTLYQDPYHSYYDSTAMRGYPYFTFYNRDGELTQSFAGYFERNKRTYRRELRKLVEKHCRKRAAE